MKITLPFTPISINHAYYFKTFKGRTIKIKTKACKEFVQRVHNEIDRTYPDKSFTEEQKLGVNITFHFNYKKTPRKHDLDNYTKILLDSLTGKAWKDDTQIYRLITQKKDSLEENKTEITIEQFTEGRGTPRRTFKGVCKECGKDTGDWDKIWCEQHEPKGGTI